MAQPTKCLVTKKPSSVCEGSVVFCCFFYHVREVSSKRNYLCLCTSAAEERYWIDLVDEERLKESGSGLGLTSWWPLLIGTMVNQIAESHWKTASVLRKTIWASDLILTVLRNICRFMKKNGYATKADNRILILCSSNLGRTTFNEIRILSMIQVAEKSLAIFKSSLPLGSVLKYFRLIHFPQSGALDLFS